MAFFNLSVVCAGRGSAAFRSLCWMLPGLGALLRLGTTREDLDELYLSDIQSVNWEGVREELRVLPVYDHTVDWSDGFADAFGGRGSPIRES